MPSMWSCSAWPALHRFSKKLAASHSRKRLWIALALPKCSLLGQGLPLAPRAQYVDDGFEHQSVRLAQVDSVCRRADRDQWLHSLPELVRYHPRLHTRRQGLDPPPQNWRFGSVDCLLTNSFFARPRHCPQRRGNLASSSNHNPVLSLVIR